MWLPLRTKPSLAALEYCSLWGAGLFGGENGGVHVMCVQETPPDGRLSGLGASSTADDFVYRAHLVRVSPGALAVHAYERVCNGVTGRYRRHLDSWMGESSG